MRRVVAWRSNRSGAALPLPYFERARGTGRTGSKTQLALQQAATCSRHDPQPFAKGSKIHALQWALIALRSEARDVDVILIFLLARNGVPPVIRRGLAGMVSVHGMMPGGARSTDNQSALEGRFLCPIVLSK